MKKMIFNQIIQYKVKWECSYGKFISIRKEFENPIKFSCKHYLIYMLLLAVKFLVLVITPMPVFYCL
ncbi:hypothetical protein, partial [Secundilactobacillus collinoides]|uniref:hypothetical protein n=1 Tax=Secundilactobacillus collinoides TaxID=33960 RepID=UPI001F3DA8B6